MRLPERFCATRVRLLLVKRTHISHPISRYKEGNASNKGLRNEGGGGVSYASGVKSISDISVMYLILSGVGLEGDIHQINGRWGGVVVFYASCVKSISVMHLILSGVGLEGDIHQINGRWGGVVVFYASCVKSISVMHLILSGVGLEGDIHHINGRCGGGCGIVCFLVLKV